MIKTEPSPVFRIEVTWESKPSIALTTETESFSSLQSSRFSSVPMSIFPEEVKAAEYKTGSPEREN